MMLHDRENHFASGELWSLLELLKLDGKDLLEGMYNLQGLMMWASYADKKPDDEFFCDMVGRQVKCALPFIEQLEGLGLRMSAIQLRKLMEVADKWGVNYGSNGYYKSIENASLQAHGRIIDEVSLIHLYSVESRNVHYIKEGQNLFGEGVLEVFPSALYDLDEAATCLGMARNTAAVFHLMRAMETAIYDLAKILDVKAVNKKGDTITWGVIGSAMQTKVDAMEKAKRGDWPDIMAHLNSVRLAWRNDTMHPKKTYTDDEAKSVFESVKSFMRAAALMMQQ